MQQFVQSDVLGSIFEAPSRYTDLCVVDSRVRDNTCTAFDRLHRQPVTVKRINRPFDRIEAVRYAYQQVRLAGELQHSNLIFLHDIYISPTEDIYLITELHGVPLGGLLKDGPLDPALAQFLMYQILRGLKYIHSAGVMHGDLTPSKLFVDRNCDLKLSDFHIDREADSNGTDHTSIHYESPEIMLAWSMYDVGVDIFSAGCIFAEMMLGKPLLPGKDPAQQLDFAVRLLGTPPQWMIQNGSIPKLTSRSWFGYQPRRISSIFAHHNLEAVNLLDSMLLFDPRERITADDALTHPYLERYHDPSDEPVAARKFDWTFKEAQIPEATWKWMIYSEATRYHTEQSH